VNNHDRNGRGNKAQMWYVLAPELAGLSGFLFPEIISPQRGKMAIGVSHKHGLTMVSGENRNIFLSPSDSFWLKEDGHIGKILGPDHYTNPIEKAVAQTIFKPDLIIDRSNDEVWLHQYGEAAVLLANGQTRFVNKSLQKGYGLVAIIRYSSSIRQIVVRHDATEHPMAAKFVSNQLAMHRRRPSGLFENALKDTWEPWLLESAKQYYAGYVQSPTPAVSAAA
jgi:hypothetical protein